MFFIKRKTPSTKCLIRENTVRYRVDAEKHSLAFAVGSSIWARELTLFLLLLSLQRRKAKQTIKSTTPTTKTMEKRKRTRITPEVLKKVRSLQNNSGEESEVVVRSFHSLLLWHALGGRQQQQLCDQSELQKQQQCSRAMGKELLLLLQLAAAMVRERPAMVQKEKMVREERKKYLFLLLVLLHATDAAATSAEFKPKLERSCGCCFRSFFKVHPHKHTRTEP